LFIIKDLRKSFGGVFCENLRIDGRHKLFNTNRMRKFARKARERLPPNKTALISPVIVIQRFAKTALYRCVQKEIFEKMLTSTVPVRWFLNQQAGNRESDAKLPNQHNHSLYEIWIDCQRQPAKYPAVAGFKATVDKNTNAVNLSWTESKVPETVGYEIEIRDANGLPIVISGVTDTLIDSNGVTGKVTLSPIAGLEPGKYTILVRAITADGIKSVKDAKKTVTVKA
jgi:hypothetical protein